MTKTYRATIQRTAIRNALTNSLRPLNLEEILKAGQSNVPSLGLATVYRNVKRMIEEGDIRAISGAGIPDCYVTMDKSNPGQLFQVGKSLFIEEPEKFTRQYSPHIVVGYIAPTGANSEGV
jgi:hypothetical protein